MEFITAEEALTRTNERIATDVDGHLKSLDGYIKKCADDGKFEGIWRIPQGWVIQHVNLMHQLLTKLGYSLTQSDGNGYVIRWSSPNQRVDKTK